MTLANSQKDLTLTPVYKIVLTSGATSYTYEKDRILDIEFHEEPDSQTAKVLLDNSDGSLTTIDFSGYDAVISLGVCIDSVDTYQARPPLKVISQDFYSGVGVGLVCQLYLVGIPDRLEADKASKDYYHHYSDTKKVKALLTEVLSGVAVTSEITESQESADTDRTLKATYWGAGQRITLVKKTVTKVSFRLKKAGSATGNITFYIRATSDLTILNSKVWGDASGLTTSYQWIEATFVTPVEITDEVYIYAGYENGAGADYVLMEFQASDVKSGSCMVNLQSTGAESWDLATGHDCAFRYKYTGAGVDCFTHCEAYIATYDPNGTHTGGTHATVMTDSAATFKVDALIGQVIYNTTDVSSGVITDNDATTVTVAALAGGTGNNWELNDAYIILDTLMDVYLPKDSLVIRQGDSRLSVVNKLLDYTKERKRAEADGKPHIFVPTTTGTTYDAEYSLASEAHQFFAKSLRKGLVIPNKITVKSYPDDTDQWTGSYTHTASHDLLPIEVTIRAKLTGHAQGTSIATAMIANLLMEQQKGTAKIPMDCLTEVYDYVKVTDAWENDNRVGNIGYITRRCGPEKWEMTFGFGRQRLVAVAGARTLRGMLYPFIPDPYKPGDKVTYGFFDGFKDILYDQLDIMVDVINTLVAFKHWWETSDEAVDAPKLALTVGDLEGQIDAVDNKLDDASVSEPTRAKDTVYQNTSDKLRLVVVTVRVNSSTARFKCDAASTPTVVRCYIQNAIADNVDLPLTWIVPPDWYYEVNEGAGTITIMEWHEADLH